MEDIGAPYDAGAVRKFIQEVVLGGIESKTLGELENSQVIDIANNLLEGLTIPEREVVKLTYGLSGDYRFTTAEISRIFRTNPQNIVNAQLSSREKILNYPKLKELTDYLI